MRQDAGFELGRHASCSPLLWAGAIGLLLLAVAGSMAQDAPPPQTYSISGVVKSGNAPIPGATVTATNSSSGEKTSTSSDLDGTYTLPVAGSGKYELRADMPAFAPGTREIIIDHTAGRADLELTLQSRTQQAARAARSPSAAARANRGFQSLSVMQGMADAANGGSGDQIVPSGMPVPGMAGDAATESVSISGSGSGVGMFGMSTDELDQRMREGREQGGFGGPGGLGSPNVAYGGGPGGGGPPGGGFGGFGGGGGRGGPMVLGGGRGRFDINRPHGSVYYSVGNSALDAAPYALTQTPVEKAAYMRQRFGASMGGPLNIPKIYNGGSKTFFFVNYNGSRGDSPYDAFSTVPTLAERTGDFSGVNVQLVNPNTGQPIPGNNFQNAGLAINPIAQGLLNYIPLPNVPGANANAQNFHFVTSTLNDSDDLNVRIIQSLGGTITPRQRGRRGPRNNLNVGFHYHSASANVTNPFPSVGGTTSTRSFDVPVGYTRTFGKLINNARLDFNRSRIRSQNLYAFNQDITGDLGISGVSSNPFDWGLPNLGFTHFGSLNDVNPQLLRNQTWTFSDNMIYNHGKHTVRWGGDFRRIQINTETDSNARGTFTFTGVNTGYDFSDFLLGMPQLTSVQFGNNSYHFRGNSWDLFGQDEWRVRGNLTLNLGVRYEYLSPFSELNDRIVNLDLPVGFTSPPVPVQVGQSGPYNGQFPMTLVRPDRNNFAPRLGLAWKPLHDTVVRAGYGINYNTSAYQSIVQNMAFQPPFSTTATNTQSPTTQLSLANGFPPVPPGSITNNFGVDPNYRLGYVQIWNVDIQQQIRPTLIMNLDYTGTKGTRLDILEAPNRTATGVLFPGVQPFYWEDSVGDSTANAGSVRVRKRLQGGLSIGGRYTFSKSLDNASSIGSGEPLVAQGGGRTALSGVTNVAQNAFDLAAERGLSSFDQRHQFTADYLWELPFGHDRRWLTGNGPLRAIFGDWNWSGDWTIASGLPFTPRVLGDPTDVSRGTNGTIRADVVPGQAITVPDPSIAEWFNTAAFVAPPGAFGDARRNSIEGPGQLDFDMAFTKIFPISESRFLEFRGQFSNIFNTPQYLTIDSVVNSPTFGRVISVGAMRSLQLTARFRF
ncbi:MAG TPA: TonB-dependent receptor [Terriglobales bacterium]|nr:TonB-dependent receptor [Terriglobales bacterium]